MCEPKFLFEPPYISDPFEVFKNCFDMIYRRGKFLDAIKSIINKIGFGYQGAYCNFPDWDGPEEELYFEGVIKNRLHASTTSSKQKSARCAQPEKILPTAEQWRVFLLRFFIE